MIRIAVVGTGYVGLVTGACLADFGNRVVCADVDASKIQSLEKGQIPFYEPGLEELVRRNVKEGRLAFSADVARAVGPAHVVFIAVGTPPAADGSADLSAVFAVGRLIAKELAGGYKVVVQKSTVPVGTARRLWEELKRHAGDGGVDVASNPEFLREGSALETFLRPDRVVLGAETPRSERLLRAIYRPLYLIETPMVVTTLETAELIKYAANAFLAMKVSYINEIANLCEAVGADVQTVAKAVGLDGRIGRKFLHAGPGYGGSCFPKDTLALATFAREKGERLRLVESTSAANEAQKARMVDKIEGAVGSLTGKRIALLGLSFKPNTDDIREAPALDIAAGLLKRGARVVAHDPAAMEAVRATSVGKKLEFAQDPYEAAHGADAVVIVTEWNLYRRLDLRMLAKIQRRPVLVDLRNLY
ncbi:MAG TPA: UDP-glucose/GDP-mannose dehydrogenase family protein, partial [Candidatus Eisenbacteria bacterium]|nr:UDP-glucose/GDP-mannose dehydrogenase family protein [Candidatus Eisenbacteria bacterium]